MLMTISLFVLYVFQLVVVVKRWALETISMVEDAREIRVKRAIDWTMTGARRS